MMIKEREVAFVKTTGEAVFVLDISDPSPKIGDKDLKAQVRRPIYGQNGNTHAVEEFYVSELETKDEQRVRIIAEQKQIYEKFGTKADELPSTSNLGFSEN